MAGNDKDGQGNGSSDNDDFLMPQDEFEKMATRVANRGEDGSAGSYPTDVAAQPEVPVAQAPVDLSGFPSVSRDGDNMTEEIMHLLYDKTTRLGDVPADLDIGMHHSKDRASDFLDDLEAAVHAALKNDLELDETERATIRDAMASTGSSPEMMVAIVANHAYTMYEDLKGKLNLTGPKKEAAAIKAVQAVIQAADIFPDSTYTRDNVYKIVKIQRLTGAPLSKVKALEDRFRVFEQKYIEMGLDKKLFNLSHPNFTEEMGMPLSLTITLKNIYNTISDDLSIDGKEIKQIQYVYGRSDITKYELLSGVVTLLTDLVSQVNDMRGLTEDERKNFRESAVKSAISIRKELVKRDNDRSRDTDMDSLVYKFGFALDAEEDLIKEFKKSFAKKDYLGQFLNALDNILKDWTVHPNEYIIFDHVLNAADRGFEEGLDDAVNILVTKLRDHHEGVRDKITEGYMKKTGKSAEALSPEDYKAMDLNTKKQVRKQAEIAADAVASFIVYRLGKFPGPDESSTKGYFDMLSTFVSRIVNYRLPTEAFYKALEDPKNREKMQRDGMFCMRRFKGETETPGSMTESQIQDGIKKYGIVTMLTAMDYENAERALLDEGFVKYTGKDEIYLQSGIDIAIIEMLDRKKSDKCQVSRGVGRDSSLSFDQDSGRMNVNLGSFKNMDIYGKLEDKVEQGFITSIDPEKADQEEVIFIEKAALEKPKKEIKAEEQPFRDLQIEIDFTFQAFTERYRLKSAAQIRGTSPLLDLDKIIRYAESNPQNLRFSNAMKEAGALYFPVSSSSSSSFDSTAYEGILMVEPVGDISKWRAVNGSKILIPVKKAHFVTNGAYDIVKIANPENDIRATETHLGSGNNKGEAMYISIGINPKDKQSYGIHLMYMDTGKKRRVNYVPHAILAGPKPVINPGDKPIKHIMPADEQ